VMLYEALTGRCPFEGNSLKVLFDKQRLDPPPLASGNGIPEDLSAICMGLLARDPAQRMTGEQALALLKFEPIDAARATSAPPSPSASERVFVGRESQLAVFQAAFAATAQGVPSIAFVHGKSGIGKSALVERFLSGLSARSDVVVLAGRCYEQESMPYKALDNVIDSLARYLSRLSRHEAAGLAPRDAAALAQIFPVLRRVPAIADAPRRSVSQLDRHELQSKAFRALRELLGRLGDRKRLVRYIDDLQWGDIDSALLLRDVLRPPEAPVLLLIGSYRDGYEGRSPFLQAFEMEAFVDSAIERHDLPVGPLTEQESVELAARLLGPSGSDRANAGTGAIARESGGNPYFMQELAASGPSGGSTLDSVLLDRVEALPEDARSFMQVVAVSGRPLGQKEAYLAARLPAQDPRLLTTLRVARLIGGAGDVIECYHDRVRETIVAHLDRVTLKDCHLRLAATLESCGGDAESIAIHFEGAEDPDLASRYYTVAAESAAATLAFKHAAALYQRALDLSSLEGEERRRLLVKLADALGNAGRGLEAARNYQKAARDAREPEVFDLERKVAFWFSASGYIDDGREALEKILHRVGLHAPRRLLPAIVLQELQLFFRGMKFRERSEDQVPRADLDRIDAAWDATRSFGMIDVPMAVYLTGSHVLLALKAGEPNRIAQSLTLRTVGVACTPLIGKALSPGPMAVQEKLARDRGTPYMLGALAFSRGFVDFGLWGYWGRSLDRFQEAERIFDEKCSGVAWETSTIRIFSLWNMLYLGRYAELRRLAAAYSNDANERGDLYQATFIGGSIRPFAELAAGRPDEAMNMMDESLARWTRRKYTVQLAASVFVRAWIFLYQRDGAAAWNSITSEWPQLKRHLYLRLGGTRQWLIYTRSQAALATGQTLRIARRDARRLDRDSSEFAKSLAHLIRAGCAAKQRDLPKAARLLEAAVAGFDAAGMRMMAAAARWRLGEVTGRQALMDDAESAMKAEGVKQPASLVAVFVNGF
jgi:eukaryotic-like serine/threonine-protein kinase